MKKRLLAVLMLLGVLGLLIQPTIALAQDYLFAVTRAQVNFFINEDGTATIEYFYDFTNQQNGHIIDYVDIGVPQTNDYDMNSVTADVDGKTVTDIQVSDVVKPGIAFGLGANSIRPGASGRFHARIGVVQRQRHHGLHSQYPLPTATQARRTDLYNTQELAWTSRSLHRDRHSHRSEVLLLAG